MNQLLDNLNALVTGLFLLTAFGIVATRQARGCLNLFITQSLLLAASAALLGFRYHSEHLYGVAIVNLISKPVIVPWLLRRVSPAEIYTRREIDQALNIPTSLLIALGLVIMAYFGGMALMNAVGPQFRGPNVPIGIAGLLLGAYTLTVRREAVPLLIGLLAMENGAFLAGISMSRNLPLLVELAVATDGLVIVFIMGVLTRAVQKNIGTTAVGDLANLKEVTADLPVEEGKMSVLIILLLPLLATALVCIPGKKYWASGVTVLSSLGVLVLVARLAWRMTTGKPVLAHFNIGILKWVAVDGLSALILLLIGFVATTAAIYSVGYMAHKDLKPSRLRLYYANYNLFIFSMLAIPVMAEPTLVWIVVELTTLCSALLVSFDNTREALEAAWKYVLLSLMGAGFALFGFLVLYAAMQSAGGGVYTWDGLIKAAPAMPPILLQTAFLLILIGLGTKAGLVPMHTWLPDAHSQAPSPVCALLSGVETIAILYVVLRLFPVMHAASFPHAGDWMMVLGLISVGVAAFLLLQVRDYKRLFAFSTIEHMGIILVAVGLGSSAAGYGAMQQIVSHSITKSFCFFAAGATLLAAGTRDINSVRGLMRRSPVAGAALIFGGLAIAGAPPLAVFLSEFLILKAGLTQGHYIVTGLLTVFITIAFFGVVLHLGRMVFSTTGSKTNERFHLPLSCRLALLLAAVPVLVLGVYIPEPLHDLLSLAAGAVMK